MLVICSSTKTLANYINLPCKWAVHHERLRRVKPTVCGGGEGPSVLTPDNGEDIRDGWGGGDGTGDRGLTPPQHCRGGRCHLHCVNMQGRLITDWGLPNNCHTFNLALCNRQNTRLHWVQITITDTLTRTRK